MIVLAIDPGSVIAGYGVLKLEGRKISYVASGVLRFNAKDEFLVRIKDIHLQTLELMALHAPDEIALESLIYVKSPTALMKLAQSRGAMLAALTQRHHERIFEYAPNLIKASVTGHGHADKEGVQKVLTTILGIKNFTSHDESDALAIALCHILNRGSLKPLKTSGSKRAGSGLAQALAHKIKEPSL